jgi:hypothetical protein
VARALTVPIAGADPNPEKVEARLYGFPLPPE